MSINSEELLRAIILCSPDGYIASDETGRITFVDDTVEKITGWSVNELVGKEVSKVYSLPESIVSSSVKEEDFMKAQTAILYKKDGRKITLPARQIEIVNSVDDKKKNEFKGYLTIFHTENKIGKDLNKTQDEFISTVSHELRTPLTSIKGFADTLLRAGDKLPPENQKKYITIIKEQADRLTRLVEDLLTVSRLETQAKQLTIRALDLYKTINKVCDSLSSKSTNHKIVQVIEENIPNVWADADKLEQILTNLVDNAIKYSPNRSTVTIKVSSILNSQGIKDKLKIEIIDQGIGIAKEDLPKIFTKFGRLDNPLTRQTQGTGLGLFITKSLVLALKGDIFVESKPGRTVFIVILPAVISDQGILLTSHANESNTIKEKN